ncbi:hypothetical protein GUJ93_ZPchr0008g13492 [Zizania palustris]|uniref:Co-chaperone protein p23 n=1 Tax=Zizania palustris TaxID=103762 RepID=A0A8J5V4L3_ZIZPA|nr:hypothetical protein GUJ93_ZPchr0008g13492 [Zizania palustris]
MSWHPEVKWAQRIDKVYITVQLADAKDAKVNLEPDGVFSFSATAGTDGKLYESKLDLNDKVNVEESKISIGAPHFVKVDWDKWVDDDDDGADVADVNVDGMDFSNFGGMGGMGDMTGGMGGMGDIADMMDGMSGMGGMGGMDEFEDESDDEGVMSRRYGQTYTRRHRARDVRRAAARASAGAQEEIRKCQNLKMLGRPRSQKLKRRQLIEGLLHNPPSPLHPSCVL